MYEFKFLTEPDAQLIDDKHVWFRVRECLTWGIVPAVDDYFDSLVDSIHYTKQQKEIIQSNRRQIKENVRTLHQRLVIEELLNYYEIDDPDLDNILDIFVRVNSGGTVLSKSDLLFSTIVAHWQNGREEIEDFLKAINNKGRKFWFDNDFIMRCCHC